MKRSGGRLSRGPGIAARARLRGRRRKTGEARGRSHHSPVVTPPAAVLRDPAGRGAAASGRSILAQLVAAPAAPAGRDAPFICPGRSILAVLAVLLAASAAAAAPVRSPAQDTVFAIRDVRVFDGERVHERATVVVSGGRIAAMGRDVDVPSNAAVIDGAGHTLLPAFLDAHSHTFTPEPLEAALVFGVGTQLDMFTSPQLVAGWRAEQAAGGAPQRADISSAGSVVTAPGGHGTQFGLPIPTLASPESAQAFVDARIAEGSDWIKIIVEDGSAYGMSFPTISEGTLRAAVEVAHARGKLAVVHVARLADARAAVRAGADGLMHLWVDSVPDDAFARELAARGTFIVPTMTVLESVTGTPSGAALLGDPRVAPFVGPEARASLERAFPVRPGAPANFDAVRASLAKLHAAGVRILAGTDAPNPGTTHGASLHRELELLVQGGLSPLEALRAATSSIADAFRLEGRGRIAPGWRADLVLVAGNPLEDITTTRAIERVWKAGQPVDREAYRQRVANALAAAEAKAAAPAALAGGRALVSGFDDGSLATVFGTRWVETTDAMMGGGSTARLEVVEGGAAGTARALRITGEIAPGLPYAWAGAMFFPASPPMTPADLSAAKGLVFRARGDGGTYRVLVFTRRGGQVPAFATFTAGPEWQEHSFPWSTFGGTDGSDVMGIAIVGGPNPGRFELFVDEVELR
jgi:imidazolonepropionase-like amidohydrolase